MSGDRYPGYDVLSKRWTPSWNAATRRVIDARLSVHPGPRFFTAEEWPTVQAICARILPQPPDRPPIPLAAYVDQKLQENRRDGFRRADLPPEQQAWRRGLGALEADSQAAQGRCFHQLAPLAQDDLLRSMQEGRLNHPSWGDMPPGHFFTERVLADVTRAYYAHPAAWSEIGWGGPASPRGYVRLGFDQRDPWEAAQARPGHEAKAERENRRVGRR